MKPFAHKPAPKKNHRKFRIHAIDVETDSFEFRADDNPALRYITFCSEDGKRVSGTCMKKMLEHLLQQGYTEHDRVYAHNLEFDARYIFDAYLEHFIDKYRLRLYQRGGGAFWRIDFIPRENLGSPRPASVLSFYDSMALYGRSLAEFTKRFAPNCQKIKRAQSFDVAPFDPQNKDDREYAMQDVVSLVEAVKNFDSAIHRAFGVHCKGTISATALAACQLRLPEDTEIWRPSDDALQRERACYGGGAVLLNFAPYEAHPTVASFDVNSEYPACMRGKFPASNCAPLSTDTYHPGKLGFYHVQATMPDILLSGLQSRDPHGRVQYKTGTFETYCTGEEIEYYTKNHGAKFEIIDGHIYEEAQNHFAGFVDHCERTRKTYQKSGELDMVEIVKLMQNSVYGKFGTKPDDRFEYILDGQPSAIDEGYEAYFNEKTGEFSGIYRKIVNIDEPYMLPAFAALVTARGRLLLQKGIDICGRAEVFYCDTDSIKCTPLGADRMRASKLYDHGSGDYGLFKDEGEKTNMVFVAPKVYGTLDGTLLKAKGIQAAIKRLRESTPNLNITQLPELGQCEYYSVTGLESYMKRGGSKGTIRKRSITAPEQCSSHELRSDARFHPICYSVTGA